MENNEQKEKACEVVENSQELSVRPANAGKDSMLFSNCQNVTINNTTNDIAGPIEKIVSYFEKKDRTANEINAQVIALVSEGIKMAMNTYKESFASKPTKAPEPVAPNPQPKKKSTSKRKK